MSTVPRYAFVLGLGWICPFMFDGATFERLESAKCLTISWSRDLSQEFQFPPL